MPDIEEQIRRAIQEGKFEGLAGKGKPLQLSDDPNADPDWRLAYHIMRQGGFTPPWLELRKEIEGEIDTIRDKTQKCWEWRSTALREDEPAGLVDAEWQRVMREFRERVALLNRRIFEYNLQTPNDRFQMRALSAEKELARICAGEH